MRNPPAFQFYADDFLGGVATFNLTQRGLYITLLAIQWNQGFITQEDFESLSDGTAIAQPLAKRVLSKFQKGQDGHFRNDRLEREREKQAAFRANRSESGKAGADKRWHSHSTAIAQPMANTMAKHSSPSPSPSPIDERERVDSNLPEIPPMSRADYDAMAALRAVPAECAEWFWNTCDARNWTDAKGQPIRKVEPLLLNALTQWRANSERQRGNGRFIPPAPKVESYMEEQARKIKRQFGGA